jgi:hypothetical protein
MQNYGIEIEMAYNGPEWWNQHDRHGYGSKNCGNSGNGGNSGIGVEMVRMRLNLDSTLKRRNKALKLEFRQKSELIKQTLLSYISILLYLLDPIRVNDVHVILL